VAEAADALGISQDAVRMRVKRGTLDATKDGRQLFVLLDTDRSGVGSQPESEALISEMRGRIEDLRAQLEAERQAHSEARRLLAAALERIPPAIEARESPVSRGPSDTPTEAPEGREEPTERPWWRRVFG
jgi:hypothetical protein